jgi:hypothetical protein
VIEDARSHQHRRHRRLTGAVLLAIVAVLVAYAAFGTGGARTRFAIPAPGSVTGSLQPLGRADYQLWVTPSLLPIGAGVSIDQQASSGGSSYITTTSYPGAEAPLVGGAGYDGVHAPVPDGANADYLLFVGSNVAAVRIGNLGTVGAQTTSALPPDEKLVAFRVPRTARRVSLRSLVETPGVPVTLINKNGYAITTVAAPASRSRTRALRPPPAVQANSLTTPVGGACAVSSSLDGLTDQAPSAASTITPLAQTAPGIFLSCLDDTYAYKGAKFNVGILLDAHHPGQALPTIWNATQLAGHRAVFEVTPPPQFPRDTNETSPLFARRVANAWLVVQARPGFARNPGLAQTIQILNTLRITRIELPHS